ncbi:hypothetical protein HIM_09505 [Hirsutella minnesotensis 3608]|uniref:Heterokaryon incompatibility domain-containing protein n=1 Tax=Hirsutella minnesotensis 3608 TaxID=1043627 RepID=A0A0F7ZGL2_9HYPO|nr:hypothetical protein HIM_09505 [Hirsutella minnesotensis 3608]
MPLFTSSPLPDYRYSTLDPSQKSFRLVRLLPPKPSRLPGAQGTLRIKLVEVNVDSGVPYDALSYAWGDPSSLGARNRQVIVEMTGEPEKPERVFVHRPLELALLHLVTNGSAKLPLFVDQICINQDDESDKSHQVRLMREIYSRCSRTIIWLGLATRASYQYFDFVREICKEEVLSRVMTLRVDHFMTILDAVTDPDIEVNAEQREDRDDLLDMVRRFGSQFPLDGFADVLNRRWFNRLWIIQEACLAPTVVFICGNQSLCFDCFRAGALFYNICNLHWNNHRAETTQHDFRRRIAIHGKMAGITRLHQERKAIHRTGQRQSVYGLVLKYNVNKDHVKIGSSLPVDRIFGLLGLTADDDELPRRIHIRYTVGAVQIYTEVAALFLEENIDALLFNQFPKKTQGLPSWVPDWDMNLKVPVGYSTLKEPVFASGGPKEGARCQLDECSGRLTVRGVLVDRIVSVGQRTHRQDPEQRVSAQSDDRWAKLFFDETAKFIREAAASRNSGTTSCLGDEAKAQMSLRVCDSGLSFRYFAGKLGATAGLERLRALHDSTSLMGQRLLKSDHTVASFHITRIYRTIGITPWYWTPTSEMASLRLCARDPAAACVILYEAVVDFLFDMVCLCIAAARMTWAAYCIKFRRRFGKVRTRPTIPEVTALGLDPITVLEPDIGAFDDNILKNVGRRLYRTKTGYVGVGPAQMTPGDSVVVFHGGTVPHVLRGPEREDDESWTYLGEAYCDGIMDGEALGEGYDTMDPRNVMPKMVKALQLQIRLLTRRVLTNDEAVLFHFLHSFQVLAVEVVIHHGRPTVRESSFLKGHCFIAYTTRTLCLRHKKWKSLGLWRLLLGGGDTGMRHAADAPPLDSFPFAIESHHKLSGLNTQSGEVIEAQIVWLLTEQFRKLRALWYV